MHIESSKSSLGSHGGVNVIVVLGFYFYPCSFGLATALKDSKEYARLAKSTNQNDVKANIYTIARDVVWFQLLILEMVLSSIIDAFIILMYIWTFFETLSPGGRRITVAMGCSRGHHRSEVFDSIRVSWVLASFFTDLGEYCGNCARANE